VKDTREEVEMDICQRSKCHPVKQKSGESSVGVPDHETKCRDTIMGRMYSKDRGQ